MALPTMLEKSLTVPNDPIWRLTVEQYHQMIQDGILTEDDPVELLEGLLVTKMMYANAGIPVYWILNLPERQLEVYSQPKDGDYQTRMVYAGTDSVAVVIDGQEVGELVVGELLE